MKYLTGFILILLICASGCLHNKSSEEIYILSEECRINGGEVTNIHPERGETDCPDGKQNLGHVSDLNCICLCCK